MACTSVFSMALLEGVLDLGRHVLGQAGGGGVAARGGGHHVVAGFLEGGHLRQEGAALGVHHTQDPHLVMLDQIDHITGAADVDRDVVAQERRDGL